MLNHSSNSLPRLYADLAWTWPIISPPEDYIDEAEQFARLMIENVRIEIKTLLDLGCGGGHNDHTLQKHFQVTGVDLSPAMLDLARQLNPGVTYLIGDMCNLQLEERFDAVLIADSIYYMLSEVELKAAFQTAFDHLKPGGVFCTYAEYFKETFQNNQTHFSTHQKGDIEITFIENEYDPDPEDTVFEYTFVYLIRRNGQLSVEVECHQIGLFPQGTWQQLLQEVGFKVRIVQYEGEDIPVFVCIKPN